MCNRCEDLDKLVGGSAEMFWRGARPGYAGKVDKDFVLDSTNENKLREQLDEYEHNLRRILMLEGIEMSTLGMQIADPVGHFDIQLQMVSMVTGIPKRILVGSERGELASSQDEAAWKEMIQSRREEYAEPQIVREFVDRMIKFGVLPPPKTDYSVVWQDLFSVSDRDKAEIGKIRSEALRNYAMSPTAEGVVPPDVFMDYFLGLPEEDIEIIKQMKEQAIKEEGTEFGGEEETAPVGEATLPEEEEEM
jgi:hypothetical protein